jgi:hypothetical protein
MPDMPMKKGRWLTTVGIESLLESYDFPAELAPKLLTLVRKLDAIEDNHLLRSSIMTPDRAPTSKKAFDDWWICT